MTFEPPLGMRQSLSQTLASVSKSDHSSPPFEKSRILFMLAWLHSVVMERLRYVPIGWSKQYDFNESDFEVCVRLMNSWVSDAAQGRDNISPEKIPFKALLGLVSKNVYGGKIDCDDDQMLLDMLVEEILSVDMFSGSFELVADHGAGSLLAPTGITFESFQSWCVNLENDQSPHLLGLPAKADVLLKQTHGIDFSTYHSR